MTNTFNLTSTIVNSTVSELKDSTKSLASTILGIQELGLDDTKKALKEAYTRMYKEPKDKESLKKYQDARKKWIKRRIQTAESCLENESIVAIVLAEGDSESRFNALTKYLTKNPVALKQKSDSGKQATDDEVLARFIQAAKACDKRGILNQAINKLLSISEVTDDSEELDVAI